MHGGLCGKLCGRASQLMIALQHPITRYSSKIAILPTLHAFDAPIRGSRQNIAITFGGETLEWRGYLKVQNV